MATITERFKDDDFFQKCSPASDLVWSNLTDLLPTDLPPRKSYPFKIRVVSNDSNPTLKVLIRLL